MPQPPIRRPRGWTTFREFIAPLKWIDGQRLAPLIEPYRWATFDKFFGERDAKGRFRYNLALVGRAKKNWKTADLCFAALYALLANDSPSDNQVYVLANDEDQAGDDLALAKKLVNANTRLAEKLIVHKNIIRRVDNKGFMEILPAGDAAGAHGKTARFIGWDEIHGYKSWDILEALQPDPTRLDAQQWITSYASLYHRPGVPLYDLLATGRSGKDARMLLSWYAADWTTDPAFENLDPESRANPSRASWADQGYLDQQQNRLPAHKFRRLHLNLPGLPEGSAYTAEAIMGAIERGKAVRFRLDGVRYFAFVDMSGGSDDDAVLAIAHLEPDGRIVVDMVMNQGPAPAFSPTAAVARFAAVLKDWGLYRVIGDNFAGNTFKKEFEDHGITYVASKLSKSELYEAFEPLLNGQRVTLLDIPKLEQEFLGLGWRGSKIDHPNGEHDDWSNAVAGVVVNASGVTGVSGAVVMSVTKTTLGEQHEPRTRPVIKHLITQPQVTHVREGHSQVTTRFGVEEYYDPREA